MAEIINLDEFKKNKKKKNPLEQEKQSKISFSILKVTLSDKLGGGIREKSYRVLSIPNKQTLSMLAQFILTSFDFELDHEYGYFDNIENWIQSQEIYLMDGDASFRSTGYVTKVTVGEVFNVPDKKMLFLFDYGDEWSFIIELIRTEVPAGNVKFTPKVIEKKGNPPPQYPDFEA
ncbi:MAG TPA: hypothetical protein PK079_09415 [Leptospiraceae bacterium]|nr:hypothetical protein [Leptospiraceae bacterium]HMW06436.1 hypothetical protein [Leptospiraceae bacterium]HMX31524.1 hypothetical protein [Leptospiraceae bacterium]HMY31937.1 hypothetical protein [Leptospiraceae bacterium]HMZ63198.1 hypothetical protein [Leptospiraceae bacterium]